MKVALLHQDDYEQAIAAGARPWSIDDNGVDGELRVCVDPFYPVPKGEAVILDTSRLPRIEGNRLVYRD